MELNELIRKHVMTDREWREAYEEADATREGIRALIKARKAAGLSQAALAERVGTGQAVISRIERGAVSPTLDMVARIARALNLRPMLAFEAQRRLGDGDHRRLIAAKSGRSGHRGTARRVEEILRREAR